MAVERSQVGREFWLQWVLANALSHALGGVIGWVVTFYVAYSALSSHWNVALAFAVGGFVGGAVAGTLISMWQWSVLRQHVPQVNKLVWPIAGVIGFTLGWSVFFLVLWVTEPWGVAMSLVVSGVLGGAASGTLAGLMQWTVLQQQFSSAERWVWVYALSGIVALGVGWAEIPVVFFELWSYADDISVFFVGLIGSAVSWPVAGALAGAVTGGALVWLSRRSVPEA